MAKVAIQYVIVKVEYGGDNYSHYERQEPVGIQYAVSEAQAMSRWIWKYGDRSYEYDNDPVNGGWRGVLYRAVDINEWRKQNATDR